MKLKPSITIVIVTAFFSGNGFAGVYKCSDELGNTSYQAKPCAAEKSAVEINVKTGRMTDLSIKQKQNQKKNEIEAKIKKQQEINHQKLIAQAAERKKNAAEQSALNQQLVRDNPIQYSAFAIPPYETGKMPALVKLYEARLPEIEQLRRFAAKKALATGECKRVEADYLSEKSSQQQLVFSVDCSSAKTFHFNEKELSE